MRVYLHACGQVCHIGYLEILLGFPKDELERLRSLVPDCLGTLFIFTVDRFDNLKLGLFPLRTVPNLANVRLTFHPSLWRVLLFLYHVAKSQLFWRRFVMNTDLRRMLARFSFQIVQRAVRKRWFHDFAISVNLQQLLPPLIVLLLRPGSFFRNLNSGWFMRTIEVF